MRWLVDGMNLIGARPDGWWRDRPRAMRELVAELRAYAAATGDEVVVVFDGEAFDLDGGPGVEVAFAARRGRDAADDEIAALVTRHPGPEALGVVTSDSSLADRVRRAGSAVVGANAFRRRLDALDRSY